MKWQIGRETEEHTLGPVLNNSHGLLQGWKQRVEDWVGSYSGLTYNLGAVLIP